MSEGAKTDEPIVGTALRPPREPVSLGAAMTPAKARGTNAIARVRRIVFIEAILGYGTGLTLGRPALGLAAKDLPVRGSRKI
jgi:hypothetical protein